MTAGKLMGQAKTDMSASYDLASYDLAHDLVNHNLVNYAPRRLSVARLVKMFDCCHRQRLQSIQLLFLQPQQCSRIPSIPVEDFSIQMFGLRAARRGCIRYFLFCCERQTHADEAFAN